MTVTWHVFRLGWRVLRRGALCVIGFAVMLKMGSAAAMTATMLLSAAVYSLAFGWRLAIGLVLLLLAHEVGHWLAARAVGIPVSAPLFIPFVGAVIRLRRQPADSKTGADIALGGPAMGVLSSLGCLIAYFWSDSQLLLALAYLGSVMNLFNLIPCDPLDGGRIVAAVSQHLWWVGILIIGALFIYTANPLLLVIMLFSLIHIWQADDNDTAYYRITRRRRFTVFWQYLCLVIVLTGMMVYITEKIR